MAQDIRDMLRQDRKIPVAPMEEGHALRFMERLEQELPAKKEQNYYWLKIAATVVVVLSVSLVTLNPFSSSTESKIDVVDVTTNNPIKNATIALPKETSTLAEISPEYEEVEKNILTSIKFQLSNIKVDETNKELIDSFKKRLDNLDDEYQKLNNELLEIGPNVHSIEAMMENLTIRLSLLNRLKDKLKELERIENENYNEIQA